MQERRNIHEDCPAHSGVDTKVTINIWLSGLACVILAALLTVSMDISSTLHVSSVRLTMIEGDVDKLEQRVGKVEQDAASKHHQHNSRSLP